MAMNNPPRARADWRKHLLAARKAWITTPQAQEAQAALHERVMAILAELEPDCLGLYWPMQGEFNPMDVAAAAQETLACRLALPCAQKSPPQMHFRLWNGQPPATRDDHGIPCPDGSPVVPDVVLVPCVGFTQEGWRLGYGGGYFDRFMAAHPEVTALGVAWESGQLTLADLQPQPHDIPLMAVLTESNTWGG